MRRSQRLSGTSGKLKYDEKYHPLDEAIRPANARRRKRLHNLVDSTRHLHEEDEEEEESGQDGKSSLSGLSDEASDDSAEKDVAAIGRVNQWTDRRHPRRSTSSASVIYDTSIHPQDDSLAGAGIMRLRSSRRKRKQPSMVLEDFSDPDNAHHPSELRRTNAASGVSPSYAGRGLRSISGNTITRAPGNAAAHSSKRNKKEHTAKVDIETHASSYIQAWENLARSEPRGGRNTPVEAYAQLWEHLDEDQAGHSAFSERVDRREGVSLSTSSAGSHTSRTLSGDPTSGLSDMHEPLRGEPGLIPSTPRYGPWNVAASLEVDTGPSSGDARRWYALRMDSPVPELPSSHENERPVSGHSDINKAFNEAMGRSGVSPEL